MLNTKHSEIAPDGLPIVGFIRLKTVLSVVPVSKSTWHLGVSNGVFPAGVKLSTQIRAWDVDEIRKLIKQIKDDGCVIAAQA